MWATKLSSQTHHVGIEITVAAGNFNSWLLRKTRYLAEVGKGACTVRTLMGVNRPFSGQKVGIFDGFGR